MSQSPHDQGAGGTSIAEQILCLAREYHRAACLLEQQWQPGDALSKAPFRFSAIHAIELYLNALLLNHGLKPDHIRGLGHDLARRTELAIRKGLNLRMRTREHLIAIDSDREYLSVRYEPGNAGNGSQLNRLQASLEEVAVKVTAIVTRPG